MKSPARSSTARTRRGVHARRGEPERRVLPGVLTADLRRRARLNSLRTRRTIERTTPRFALSDWAALDVQLDDARADDHSSVAGFSSSTYVSTTSPTFTSL